MCETVEVTCCVFGPTRCQAAEDHGLPWTFGMLSNTSAVVLSTCTCPEHLPVSQHGEQIMEQFPPHQVVIVAGEAGSGRTTPLPKMCLALGLAVTGMIGHTQPRRI